MRSRSLGKILPRKMLRDIMRHKAQFISVFLMAFLAVFIYTGIGGEWRGLRRSADDYYADTNLADAFIMGNGFDSEQALAVANIAGVREVERRTIITAAGKKSSRGEFTGSPELALHFVEKNEISALWLADGKAFDIDDTDGIWPDIRFTDANGLAVGDTITLNVAGMEVEKQIRGIIYGAEYVYAGDSDSLTPNFTETGFAYLTYKAFPAPEHFLFSTILVKTDNLDGFEDKVDAALDGQYAIYMERSEHPSVAMFENEINQHRMMGDLFPIVFLLVALLTMMTTMTRIVSSQQVQIGTLKALGFSRGTIVRHYVSYGFWLAFAGAVVGGIVGPLTLPKLFYPSMSGFYTLPEWKSVYDVSFGIVAALVVVLCAAVTWFACASRLRDTPAQTLRAKAPTFTKHSIIEKIALREHFGFNAQWNLRDAVRNKMRSAMAVIGVLGCTALLVCAFGMYDSMEILKIWQYEDINKFESKLSFEESVTDEEIAAALAQVNGEAVMEGAVEIRANGQKRSGAMTITDGALIQLTDTKKNPIAMPEHGVSITHKLAALLNVGVGDTIEWHIYGSQTWVKSEVTQLNRNPTTQGLTMTRETFEALGNEFRATSIVTSESVIAHPDGISSIMSTTDIIGGWDDLTEGMMTMVFVLIVGAAALSIVVLYNLGLLSFTEKARDIATLKVMGMRTKKLRGLLLTQNMWFSVIGFLLGLPCGVFLIRVMTDSSGETFDFPVQLTLGATVASFVITFGLSAFVSILFSGKIKKLDMVGSLKTTE